MVNVDELTERLQVLKALAQSDRELLAEAEEKLHKAESTIDLNNQALEVFKVCLSTQPNVKKDLEKLATMVQQKLWDDTFRFEFAEQVDDKGNIKGVVSTVLEDDVPSKMLSNGGGMRNILGFVMRMAFILVNKNQTPIIIWDEFGNNADGDKFDAFMEILRDIQAKSGLQTIMISHSSHEFEQVFHVTMKNKVSYVVLQ